MQEKAVTSVFVVAVFIILAYVPSYVLAGPSYSVECDEVARATKLHLYDANPKTGFINASGRHPHLPVGMESFVANTPGNSIKLNIVSYKPYEVVMELASGPERVPIVSKNGASTRIGTLEKIILENHSPVEIDQQPRSGAAILVLTNGLKLRFNHCIMRGDVDIENWERTFNTEISN